MVFKRFALKNILLVFKNLEEIIFCRVPWSEVPWNESSTVLFIIFCFCFASFLFSNHEL